MNAQTRTPRPLTRRQRAWFIERIDALDPYGRRFVRLAVRAITKSNRALHRQHKAGAR